MANFACIGIFGVVILFLMGMVSSLEYPILDCSGYGDSEKVIVLGTPDDTPSERFCTSPDDITEEKSVEFVGETGGNYPRMILGWAKTYDNICFSSVRYNSQDSYYYITTSRAGLIADRIDKFKPTTGASEMKLKFCASEGSYATDGGKSYNGELEVPGLPVDGFMYWGSAASKLIEDDEIESGNLKSKSFSSGGDISMYHHNFGFMEIINGVAKPNNCPSGKVFGSPDALNRINLCMIDMNEGYCAYELLKEPSLDDAATWRKLDLRFRKVRCTPQWKNSTVVRIDSDLWAYTPQVREYYLFDELIGKGYLQNTYWGDWVHPGEDNSAKFMSAAWAKNSILPEPRLNCYDPNLPENPLREADGTVFEWISNGAIVFPDLNEAGKGAENGGGICSNAVSLKKYSYHELITGSAYVSGCPEEGNACWVFEEDGGWLKPIEGRCRNQICVTIPKVTEIKMWPDPLKDQSFRTNVPYSDIFDHEMFCSFTVENRMPAGGKIKAYVNITVVPTGRQYTGNVDASGKPEIREKFTRSSEVECENNKSCSVILLKDDVWPSDRTHCTVVAEALLNSGGGESHPNETVFSDLAYSNTVELPSFDLDLSETYFHNAVEGQQEYIAETPAVGRARATFTSNFITRLDVQVPVTLELDERGFSGEVRSRKKFTEPNALVWPNLPNYSVEALKADPTAVVDGTQAINLLKRIKDGTNTVNFKLIGNDVISAYAGYADVIFKANYNGSKYVVKEDDHIDDEVVHSRMKRVAVQDKPYTIVGVIFQPSNNSEDFNGPRLTLNKGISYLIASSPLTEDKTKLTKVMDVHVDYTLREGRYINSYYYGNSRFPHLALTLRHFMNTVTEEIRRINKASLGVSVIDRDVLGASGMYTPPSIYETFVYPHQVISISTMSNPSTLSHEFAHYFIKAGEEYPNGATGGVPIWEMGWCFNPSSAMQDICRAELRRNPVVNIWPEHGLWASFMAELGEPNTEEMGGDFPYADKAMANKLEGAGISSYALGDMYYGYMGNRQASWTSSDMFNNILNKLKNRGYLFSPPW